jgi:cytochrome c-type biogenesis protein CcmH/NrfG
MTEANLGDPTTALQGTWDGKHVYLMATVCLLLGVVVGYFLRGSASQPSSPGISQTTAAPAATQQPPTLEKMRQMADKSAAPLLDKLKSDPKNFEALNDAGKVYRATHQFKQAAAYYEKALQIKPESAATRTDLASCLYYLGDVDGALAQLDKALSYDPKFFGALLNLGIIKLQAKDDSAGAIRSWEKIVKTDPDPQHKEVAKKMIADARQKSRSEISEAQRDPHSQQ